MLRLFESEGWVRLGFLLYDIFIFFTKTGMLRGVGGTGGGGEQVPQVYNCIYFCMIYCTVDDFFFLFRTVLWR